MKNKICQSCGMPITSIEQLGTNKDEWIYVKFLDTFFRTNSSHLLLFQFPFD